MRVHCRASRRQNCLVACGVSLDPTSFHTDSDTDTANVAKNGFEQVDYHYSTEHCCFPQLSTTLLTALSDVSCPSYP